MHTAYLLLGGNEGNVYNTFERVLHMLSKKSVHISAHSAVYKSEPWGMKAGTPWFLNQVIRVQTEKSAEDLLNTLLHTENYLGRKRRAGITGSRSIDIDILLFDSLVISKPGLEIPHPRLHLRRFALLPLQEIAPGLIHPLFGKSIQTLLSDCTDTLQVEKTAAPPAANTNIS